jgi:hypothetical protein
VYDDKESRALMQVLQIRAWWRTAGARTLDFLRTFAAFHSP